jgi:MFS family permease
MIGFGVGGILMGRLSDRFGVIVPVLIGALALGLGFVAAGHAESLWQFALAQGLLIGLLGTSSAFAPLVADTSMWFTRRRGIAVAICASGNYLAGALWPTALQHYFDTIGWRATFTGVGIFCAATMIPLAFALRRKPPALSAFRVLLRNKDTAHSRNVLSRCCASQAWPAAWRCRCRRSTSSPIAATWARWRRAAPRCCR